MERKRSMKPLGERLTELRRNEEGSSLVLVMVVTAIVSTMITVILLITLINFYMKNTDVQANHNFYDAETAMDEIRTGISLDFENAFADAYYGVLMENSEGNADFKMKDLINRFCDEMETKLKDPSGGTGDYLYQKDHITGCLKETKWDGTKGAQIVTADGENWLNINRAKGTVTLKNLAVQYTDEEGYVTTITADLKMSVPKVEFPKNVSITDLMTYSLIACDHVEFSGQGADITIEGNALFGTGDLSTYDPSHLNKIENASVNLRNSGSNAGFIIAGSPLLMNAGKLNANNMTLWMEQVSLEQNSSFQMTEGQMFLRNDLALGNGAKVELARNLVAYGNTESLAASQSAKERYSILNSGGEVKTILADMQENPANYSSAILVNGANAVLKLENLERFHISGNSYVNNHSASGWVDSNSVKPQEALAVSGDSSTTNPNGIVMGNSIALKSDQRTFMIPVSAVAPDCTNGRTNPMTKEQYNKLLDEIKATKGGKSVEKADMVNFDLPLTGEAFQGKTLRELGVSSYYTTFYQMKNTTMCFLFCKFDTEDSQEKNLMNANEFYRLYTLNDPENLNRLNGTGGNLERYFDYSNGGLSMPELDPEKVDFYFNGNVIRSREDSAITLSTQLLPESETVETERREEALYQDTFFAMKRNLITEFEDLTDQQKKQGLFYNLLNEKSEGIKQYRYGGYTYSKYEKPSLNDLGSGNATGAELFVYKENNTYYYAYLCKGDVTYPVKYHGSYGHGTLQNALKVIIATGDVTVDSDFSGLIIAGGTVKVKQGVTVKSDSAAVQKAMKGTDYNGVYYAYDYFVNPSWFRVGGAASGSDEDEDSDMTAYMIDYMAYENWKRR